MTNALRWEPVSYRRNEVVAYTNIGRFYVRRSAKHARTFTVSLNGETIGKFNSFELACRVAETRAGMSLL